ncbi:MAG: YidH family protein [Propionibacteriaceae bacterium]
MNDSTPEPSKAPDRRWPRSVYGVGQEPDPRFTFANERTFLAWIRTGLGFLAAGVAISAVAGLGDVLDLETKIASILLVACGLFIGVGSWSRWVRNERALRQGRPLPSSVLIPFLTVGLVIVALVAFVVLTLS